MDERKTPTHPGRKGRKEYCVTLVKIYLNQIALHAGVSTEVQKASSLRFSPTKTDRQRACGCDLTVPKLLKAFRALGADAKKDYRSREVEGKYNKMKDSSSSNGTWGVGHLPCWAD